MAHLPGVYNFVDISYINIRDRVSFFGSSKKYGCLSLAPPIYLGSLGNKALSLGVSKRLVAK